MQRPALYFTIGLLTLGAAFYAGRLTERHSPAPASGPGTATRHAATVFRLQLSNALTHPALQPDLWLASERDRITCLEHLLATVKKLDLHTKWNLPLEQAADKLKDRVEVVNEPGTGTFAINAYGPTGMEAADIANTLRTLYTDWTRANMAPRMKALRQGMTAAMDREKAEVEAARTEFGKVGVSSGFAVTEEPGLDRMSYSTAKFKYESLVQSMHTLQAAMISADRNPDGILTASWRR